MASWQGRKVWAAGDKLGAADLDALVDQSVMVFATVAARTSAIASPTEGMTVFMLNENRHEYYDGAVWQPMAGAMPFVIATLATQSLTSGTDTTLVMVDSNNRSFGTITNSGGTFTVGKAGIYRADISLTYANNPTGYRQTTIVWNGTAYQSMTNANSTTAIETLTGWTGYLPSGGTIAFKALQNSGAAGTATTVETMIHQVSA